jgi:hypothetical protein
MSEKQATGTTVIIGGMRALIRQGTGDQGIIVPWLDAEYSEPGRGRHFSGGG